MLEGSPYPNIRIDGFVDAAEASALLGDPKAAARYAEEALRVAVAKGNIARAGQITTLLKQGLLFSIADVRPCFIDLEIVTAIPVHNADVRARLT